MRTIVGLCGYARAGKDSVAKILVERDGFTQHAFADELRALVLGESRWAQKVIGDARREHPDRDPWEVAKETPRTESILRALLQTKGMEVREESPDYWVDVMRRKISSEPTDRDIVVSDVRFSNEEALIREFGGEIWLVERPGVGPANRHVSELFEAHSVDRVIVNDGTLTELGWKV